MVSLADDVSLSDDFALSDDVERVRAPPELCTIPDRGSAVDASLDDEVERAWVSIELCTVLAVEPEVEPADAADELVADVPVDDVLVPGSDGELESAAELEVEPDDGLELLVSAGSASATPGVFATAAPTYSTAANALTRAMYCGFIIVARFLAASPL